MVQYRRRSLEATERIRLKTRGRRLKSKIQEHQKTPDFREHKLTRAHLKASIPTLKPSCTQEPTSTRARHTTLILQQCRNVALSFNIRAAQSHTKPTDTSKLTTGHFIALQREEIHQNTDTSFPNQETLTSHSSNPIHREEPPQKKKPQTFSLQKDHHKHSNLNKIKRQRNTQQVREHDKCPPNQTKEEEIGSPPEKEFRMIVKMTQNL